MRVAVFGTGYWAQFQIAVWQSLGVEVAAVWNRTYSRARETAERFGIPRVFENKEEVFERCDFDVCDIIADVGAHHALVALAASHGKPVICQKPMASTFEDCREMAHLCGERGIWGAIHENFRFQPQFTKMKELLTAGAIGKILRAELKLKSPDRAIIAKQPALAAMDHMALRDMGPHIFDVARYLFGEMREVYSRPVTEYADLCIVDSALSILTGTDGLTISCDLVHDFEYKALVVGERGRLILDRDNVIHLQEGGTQSLIDTRDWPKLPYIPDDDWEIHGGHVFTAIPRCLRMLIDTYTRGVPAETSIEDNLRTMQLVFAAIRSQDENRPVLAAEYKEE